MKGHLELYWMIAQAILTYSQKIIMTDICNHHRNIQAFLIEVFKMKNRLAPPIMESILNKR